ncbi:hypothetical protein SAMN03080615_00444 [Amphritea atlantica]|uniref:Uncharacterized protein n=1 Tax=Amphritea atlantica TaxID=355243 RepID=A0A1H9DCF5_9GAMM|nr:hypothetical protein [Amphritea atlantica]SEQ10523.1 hypothetical protein SAMN03080615_00444 [Amphritea atlantica]
MAINTQHYTDAKAAQAHIGFLLLLLLDLLSKDQITGYQSFASIFIGIAIPALVLSLILLPKEDETLDTTPKFQFRLAVLSNLIGHGAGIFAIASILCGFNFLAGIMFLVVAVIAYFIFIVVLLQDLGFATLSNIYEYVYGKPLFESEETEIQDKPALIEEHNSK